MATDRADEEVVLLVRVETEERQIDVARQHVVVQVGHRVDRDPEAELPHEAVGGPWLEPDLRRVPPVTQPADETDRRIETLLHFGGFELGNPAVIRIVDDGAERRVPSRYARAAGVQEPSDHLEIL